MLEISGAMGIDLYIVGGTLRDHLLQRESTDYDFSLKGAESLSTQFARNYHLPFVTLDKTPGRETTRVVIQNRIYFDFTEMQGESIEEDLLMRDFTLNAMGITLQNFLSGLWEIIDPANGQKDINQRIIRMVSDSSFPNDPLRMLRSFRFAGSLHFLIANETLNQIECLNLEILKVAPERIHYELTQLFNSDHLFPYLKSLGQTGLLGSLVPEILKCPASSRQDESFWETSLQSHKFMDQFLSFPKKFFPTLSQERFQSIWEHRSLIRLALLLQDLDEEVNVLGPSPDKKNHGLPETCSVLRRLRFSNSDTVHIAKTICFQKKALATQLKFAMNPAQGAETYRFVKEAGNELPSSLILTCVGNSRLLSAAGRILDFFYDRYLTVKKSGGLINGDDLMQKFKLSPGPMIGKILDQLEEGQVLGTIKTPQEAEEIALGIIDPK